MDGVVTQHIWDGDNVVAEANSANAILRSYTRGHQLLTDDDRRAYMYDGHGNLVQQNRGTAAENVTRYDAYGNKIEKSGTANDTPFGYCGEYLDKESGLIYLRNRYYDSESGRFITEDPIKDGVNWYAYCSGNPVMFLDPSGLDEIILWSYGKDDIKTYEENYNKNNDNKLVVDGKMDEWSEEIKYDFYLTNPFYRAALTKRAELINKGVPEDKIQVIRIDDIDALNEVWNNLSSGNIVVDNLYFYSHGTGDGPEVHNGSGNFWYSASSINWSTNFYDKGPNGEILMTSCAYFYGCDTGLGSFAQNFADKQEVMVIAQTGKTSFSGAKSVHIPIKSISKDIGVFLETFESNHGLSNKDGEGKKFYPRR
ncbi:MAG: RHS repeat-associated core domain-containing protein [Clostridia bacterium]|nr:RHS repeat-associated core domain-containing protein [Clostridia bacterium]